MRAIKFRGIFNHGNTFRYSSNYKECHVNIGGGQSEHRVWVGDMRIRPESLGQFTGITDMNKKEIYEGDILHYKYDGRTFKEDVELEEENYSLDFKGVVEFKQGSFILVSEDERIETTLNVEPEDKNRLKFIVIGNIHEVKEV